MSAQYEKESESGSIIARNVYACFWASDPSLWGGGPPIELPPVEVQVAKPMSQS